MSLVGYDLATAAVGAEGSARTHRAAAAWTWWRSRLLRFVCLFAAHLGGSSLEFGDFVRGGLHRVAKAYQLWIADAPLLIKPPGCFAQLLHSLTPLLFAGSLLELYALEAHQLACFESGPVGAAAQALDHFTHE